MNEKGAPPTTWAIGGIIFFFLLFFLAIVVPAIQQAATTGQEGQFSEVKNKLGELSGALTSERATISELKSELSALRVDVASQEAVKNLGSQVDKVSQKLDTIQQEITLIEPTVVQKVTNTTNIWNFWNITIAFSVALSLIGFEILKWVWFSWVTEITVVKNLAAWIKTNIFKVQAVSKKTVVYEKIIQ